MKKAFMAAILAGATLTAAGEYQYIISGSPAANPNQSSFATVAIDARASGDRAFDAAAEFETRDRTVGMAKNPRTLSLSPRGFVLILQ